MHESLLVRSPLQWIIWGLTGATIFLCWPLWPALILASWTAELMRPLLVRFERGLKGRRRAAATLALLLFFVLLVPLVLVILGVISGVKDLVSLIGQASSAKSALEAIAAGPDGLQVPRIPTDLSSAAELLQRFGDQGWTLVTNVAGAAATVVVAAFIYFGGAFIFLLEGPQAWAWVQRHVPLTGAQLGRFAAAFVETGRGLLVGVGLTSATQAVVATLAYVSLGVPRWWVLGPITGLASIVPLAGSALVWGPISAGLFVAGHPSKGPFLRSWGLG